MSSELLGGWDGLLTAALNGSCQGVLLALAAGLSLRLPGRTNAATRHAVWFATLLLLALLLPAHYLCRRPAPRAPGPWNRPMPPAPAPERAPAAVAALAEPMPGPATPPDSAPSADPAPGQPAERTDYAEAGSGAFRAQAGHLRYSPLDTGAPATPLPALSPGAKPRWHAERFLVPEPWDLAVVSGIPRSAGLILLAVWLAVAGARLGLLARGIYQLGKVKDASSPASAGLEALFQRLRSELAVSRAVKLNVSQSHRAALLLGWVRPVIVLPAECAREPGLAQAEQVLRHELAHVRRRDDWTNLAQRLIEAVLFFNPAVWWISKRLSLEREIACDDSVLHHGARPQPYALLLAELAGRMTGRIPSVAAASSSSNSQLQERIAMILDTHRNTSPRLAKARLGLLTSSSALIAVLALYSGPRLVLAQSQTPAAPPPSAPAAAPAPQAEAAPAAAVAPLPPVAPAPAVAPSVAVPQRPPRPQGVQATGPQGASIEARLDRLERMVRRLLAEQSANRPSAEVENPAPEDETPRFTSKDRQQLEQRIKREVAHAVEQARQEVARAAEEAKRALEQAKPAFDQAKRSYEQAQRAAKEAAENFIRERQAENAEAPEPAQIPQNIGIASRLSALQRQRESLERHLRKLDQEIQRLRDEQEPGTTDKPPRAENRPGQPNLDAKLVAARAQVASLKTAVDAFEVDNGFYPRSLTDLVRQPQNAASWHGPYLDQISKDPWGQDYIYACPGKHNPGSYDLSSLGPPGEQKPIGNWSADHN